MPIDIVLPLAALQFETSPEVILTAVALVGIILWLAPSPSKMIMQLLGGFLSKDKADNNEFDIIELLNAARRLVDGAKGEGVASILPEILVLLTKANGMDKTLNIEAEIASIWEKVTKAGIATDKPTVPPAPMKMAIGGGPNVPKVN